MYYLPSRRMRKINYRKVKIWDDSLRCCREHGGLLLWGFIFLGFSLSLDSRGRAEINYFWGETYSACLIKLWRGCADWGERREGGNESKGWIFSLRSQWWSLFMKCVGWLLEVGSCWNLVVAESWGIRSAGICIFMVFATLDDACKARQTEGRTVPILKKLYYRKTLHILVVFPTHELIYIFLYKAPPAGNVYSLLEL